MIHGRGVAALVAIAVVVSACGTAAPAQQSSSPYSGSITVLAASSLTAAFQVLGTDFEGKVPGTKIDFNFAGSSTLVGQIEAGATGDVFASADQANMQKLVSAGLAAESPVVFARNRLEIVVAAGNPKHVTGLSDLSRPGLLVALCQAAVPCGRYAKEAITKAGVTVRPATEEVDVKGVLSKVALGQADAGIVYVTDVKAGGERIQGVLIPDSQNVLAEYPIVLLKDAQNPALGTAFIAYLGGSDAQGALAQYGFVSP